MASTSQLRNKALDAAALHSYSDRLMRSAILMGKAQLTIEEDIERKAINSLNFAATMQSKLGGQPESVADYMLHLYTAQHLVKFAKMTATDESLLVGYSEFQRSFIPSFANCEEEIQKIADGSRRCFLEAMVNLRAPIDTNWHESSSTDCKMVDGHPVSELDGWVPVFEQYSRRFTTVLLQAPNLPTIIPVIDCKLFLDSVRKAGYYSDLEHYW